MKPNTDKPKTAMAGRGFRGLEVAQAALLLVLGVAVAMVLYFVMMDVIQAVPVPDVQLNPYYSHVYPSGNNARVVLKFGKPGVVTDMKVENSLGEHIASCTPAPIHGGSFPLTVSAGKEYMFICVLYDGAVWDTRMTVFVWFAEGRRVDIQWVVG
jgi:hypothetical protein